MQQTMNFESAMVASSILLICIRIILIYTIFQIAATLLNATFSRSEYQSVVHPAIIGMCFIQVASYYWLYSSSRGIGYFPIFLIITMLLISMLVHRMKFIHVMNHFVSQVRKDLLTIGVFLFVYVCQWFSVIRNYGDSISSWNNDVISYGIYARHIRDLGFDQAGPIVGTNLGLASKGDVIGAYSLLAFLSGLYRINIEDLFLPALGAAFLMLVLGLKHSLQNLMNGRISQVATPIYTVTIPVVAYLGSCYFYAQILSMAIGLSLIFMVLFSHERKWADLNSYELAIGGLIFAGLFLTYPQYVPVLLVILSLVAFRFCAVSKSIQIIFRIVVQLILGSLLILPQWHNAVDRALSLAGNSTAGWSMPWVSPIGLLGLNNSVFLYPSLLEMLASMLLVMFLIFAYLVHKEGISRYVVKLGLLILLIYSAVLIQKGSSSYVQFKWISWFAPIFFAVFVYSVARFRLINASIFSRRIVPMLLILTMSFNVYKQKEFNSDSNAVIRVPGADVKNLADNKVLNEFGELNVKTGDFHESMWPVFFIEDTKVALLDNTYFSSSQPVAAPTLVKSNYATLAGVNRVPVNDSYDVIPFPAGLNSKSSTSVKSQIIGPAQLTFARGTEFELALSVSNTGAATWLGSGGYDGAVNLGVRIRAKNGIPLAEEMQRVSLGDFPSYMTSGITRSVLVVLVFEEVGDYLIQIEPVSEGLFWFSEFDLQNSLQIEVKVTD
jgi:hypothetical protein